MTEYLFAVPKDYRNPGAGEVHLFARSATKHESALASASAEQSLVNQRPWSKCRSLRVPPSVE